MRGAVHRSHTGPGTAARRVRSRGDRLLNTGRVEAILGSIVGGLLAIAGGVFAALAADRRQRNRWQHDTQLRVGSELLGALQTVVRRLRDVAAIDDKESTAMRAATDDFHEATSRWNGALNAALMATPRTTVDLLFSIDREIDRLAELTKQKRFSTADFRSERLILGRMVARYVDAVRSTSGLPALNLPSAWSWDSAPATTGGA